MAGLIAARSLSKKLFRGTNLPHRYGLKTGLGFAGVLIALDFLTFGLGYGMGATYLRSGLPILLYGGCLIVPWAGAKHV